MSDFAQAFGREIAEQALASRAQEQGVLPLSPDGAANRSGMQREAPPLNTPSSLNATAIVARIKAAKKHWDPVFKTMRADIRFARGLENYVDQEPDDERYRANIIFSHLRTRVAALYSKNPTAIYTRAPRRDFAIWDQQPESLEMARQILASAQQGAVDPKDPELQLQVQQAAELLQDAENGQRQRRLLDAVGDTLVTLVHYYLREQQPRFKRQMKRLVRRAKTAGVGWLLLDYKRVMENSVFPDQGLQDSKETLDEVDRLRADLQDGEFTENDKEAEQLTHAEETLLDQDQVILREGPEVTFPKSTTVILDPKTTQIEGFIGTSWLAVEAVMTVEHIKATYKVDMGKTVSSMSGMDGTQRDLFNAGTSQDDPDQTKFVKVWIYFHRPTGLRYVVADGWPEYLEAPKAPAARFESFFPLLPLTFGDMEEDDEGEPRRKTLYPVSDVNLLRTQQLEYNRRREGERQHRIANRPLYGASPEAFDEDEDFSVLSHADHDLIKFKAMSGDKKLEDIVQEFPKQQINPNNYETETVFTDIARVVGSQESDPAAASSGSTATVASIAEGKQMSTLASDVDDLDDFLSLLVRERGKLCLREVSEETVKRVVGPGAVWPTLSGEQIAEEVFLEIEAGSAGRPNQAQDVANLERMAPFLMQVPGIPRDWLARRMMRAVDDRVDLTDAYLAGAPSIVAINAQAQPSTGDPATDPNQQGAEGGANNPVAQAPETEGAPDQMLRQQAP